MKKYKRLKIWENNAMLTKFLLTIYYFRCWKNIDLNKQKVIQNKFFRLNLNQNGLILNLQIVSTKDLIIFKNITHKPVKIGKQALLPWSLVKIYR
jgi:hypothetical protein